jgi:hypothetical protein
MVNDIGTAAMPSAGTLTAMLRLMGGGRSSATTAGVATSAPASATANALTISIGRRITSTL